MDALSLGPFVLSFERFTALVSVVALVIVAELLAKRTDKRLASWANNVVLIGFFAARSGFVLLHSDVYLEQPLSIVYIWQGGFSIISGILAGLLYSAWFYRRDFKNAKWILTPSLAALVIYTGLTAFAESRPPAVTELPDIQLEHMDGSSIRLSDFEGQPTVINIWATWCGPCQRELPMLAQAQNENGKVHFVFIDQGETAETVQAYLNQKQVQLEHSLLDLFGEAGNIFRVVGTPTTLFFDAEGQIVRRHVGEISRAALQNQIKRLQH